MTQDHVTAFLAAAGWGKATRKPLAGDASARRFTRVIQDAGHSAILMETPQAQIASQTAFRKVAVYLTGLGLSAPMIFASDDAAGLMLVEDFGDGLFSRLTEAQLERAPMLYGAAEEVLGRLARTGVMAGCTVMAPIVMAQMVELAFDELPKGHALLADRARFCADLAALCTWVLRGPMVTGLRDFHAGNLIWLPERDDVARVGLIDFQDAVSAPQGYDLISLTDDARRDVDAGLRAELIARHGHRINLSPADMARRCALLSLQRNLRILGVFARLARQGKAHYLAHLPRVAHHIERAATHPDLSEIAATASALAQAHLDAVA